MNKGAWWATVLGVAKSWTGLSDGAGMHAEVGLVVVTDSDF